MAEPTTETGDTLPEDVGKYEGIRTLLRCLRYLEVRSFVVLLTVMAGVCAAIWVTNLGGDADEQRRDSIEHNVMMGLSGVAALPPAEQEALIQQALESAYAAAGLDKPFFVRSFHDFRQAFTLSLGQVMTFSETTTLHRPANAKGTDYAVPFTMGDVRAAAQLTLSSFGVSSRGAHAPTPRRFSPAASRRTARPVTQDIIHPAAPEGRNGMPPC
jgi:hypothetical protein